MEAIGHNAVRERFRRTVSRGRLASTYLFVGPEGVGKRTYALELAQQLLCTNRSPGGDLSACGDCESCRLVAAGGHPDLLQVAKPAGKSSLPVEVFIGPAERRNREGLCHDIALKPYLATRRIAIIDDADDLSIESANCLLKTLEEPAPRSVMILIGVSLAKQLPTIRSRCQVVRFGALSDDDVAAVLTSRGLVPEGGDPLAMAAAGAGSVSRALSQGDEGLAQFRSEFVRTLTGGRFDPLRAGADLIEQSQAGSADPATRRARLRTVLGDVIEQDRQTLRESAAEGDVVDVLIQRLDASLSAVEAIDRNANQAAVVQAWLGEICAADASLRAPA